MTKVVCQVAFMSPDECVRRLRVASDADAAEMLRTLESAAREARDAEWREAMKRQDRHCEETIDHVYRNLDTWPDGPDKAYPYHYECVHCAPLRSLLRAAPVGDKP